MKLSHDPCVCGGATRLMYKNETHYYCEKCGGEVMPHDCGVVGVKREDLDEAIVFLIACRPTFKKAKNVRDISKLIERLRAAKGGASPPGKGE